MRKEADWMVNVLDLAILMMSANIGGCKANIEKTKNIWFKVHTVFVCVQVLQPSQPNGVMSSMVSLPNYTFTGQA